MSSRLVRMIVAVVALLLVGTMTAFAQSGTPEPVSGTPGTSTDEAPESHCVVWTIPSGNASEIAKERVTELVPAEEFCFSTEEEVDDFIESSSDEFQQFLETQAVGQVDQGATTERSTGDVSLAATNYWVRLYADSGYGGSSKTWSFGQPCGTYGYSDGVAVSWVGSDMNDRASSARSSSGSNCRNWRFYPDADWYGTRYGCQYRDANLYSDCWYVGNGINDRTSSFEVFP